MGPITPDSQLTVGHRAAQKPAPKHIADRDAGEVRGGIGEALRGRVGYYDWFEGDGDLPHGRNYGRQYYLKGSDHTVTLDDLQVGAFLPLKASGTTEHLNWTAALRSYRGGTAIYEIDDDPSLS